MNQHDLSSALRGRRTTGKRPSLLLKEDLMMKNILHSQLSSGLLIGALLLSLTLIGGCDGGLFEDSSPEVSQASISADYVGSYGDQRVRGTPAHYGSPAEMAEYEPTASADRHTDFGQNPLVDAAIENKSTFSVDVNTASYTMMRSRLNAGRLPAPASVRTEEFINFFDYDYRPPEDGPFSIHTEMAPSYFGSDDQVQRHLMKIGVKAREVPLDEMKPNNLVFLIDVSGSMRPEVRLPLAKKSLHILLENLRPTDTVAIQTYASGSDTVLEPTPVRDFQTIDRAIDNLVAEGGTNGEGGIRDAYDMAEQAFVEGGNNRVIILTDGDFNVGKRGDDIVEMVRGYRERQIAMTAVGFGHGNHNDAVMEELAREGHGNYFYIDTLEEAHRIFGTHLTSTLEVIASDVRIQVEFNEEAVKNYRLLGYEKRVLDNEDFEKESTNAAEVGPGHEVTAFYEVELRQDFDELPDQVAQIRVRYKEELLGHSLEVRQEVLTSAIKSSFHQASPPFQFATAVAEFAGILRRSNDPEDRSFDEIHRVAKNAMFGHHPQQEEFLTLVTRAQQLW